MLTEVIASGVPPLPDLKPAKNHIAKAVPAQRGGFHAQFAFPGVAPQYVNDRGVPVLYDDEEEAEKAACVALFKKLNARPKDRSTPESYRRLTGAELAVLIAEAGITPTFFSYLNNTRLERLFNWIDGVEDKDLAPHQVRVLLEIFKRHPETIDTAEAVTEAVTSQRKPPRDTGEGI